MEQFVSDNPALSPFDSHHGKQPLAALIALDHYQMHFAGLWRTHGMMHDHH